MIASTITLDSVFNRNIFFPCWLVSILFLVSINQISTISQSFAIEPTKLSSAQSGRFARDFTTVGLVMPSGTEMMPSNVELQSTLLTTIALVTGLVAAIVLRLVVMGLIAVTTVTV